MAHNGRPLIGLPADLKEIDGRPFHSVGDKYARAVAEAAGAVPVILPALDDAQGLRTLLARMDGICLTGSLSNVHPSHYDEAPAPAYEPYDPARDGLTLPLIEMAVEVGVPLFAICRGFQEMNVAFGGGLATEIQEDEGRLDHRAPEVSDDDVKYGPNHAVDLAEGGVLHGVLKTRRIMVNSLHRQAVTRIGAGLEVEAVAPDGIVEGLSVKDAPAFALGVQWHPEYRATANPISSKLFAAFGEAARARMAAR